MALGRQLVQVVLSRPLGAPDGYQLALVTTDLAATPAAIIERYADRWSEEQAFLDARHLAGVGQARTRTKRSVQRLVPFGLCCLSLAICCYAHHGQPAQDLTAHRARAPWYRHKHTVSVADMLAALRRALLAAQYQHGHPDQHTLDLFPDLLLTQLNPAA
jgi:cytochrome c-type biogenesis protein CcmH/NrfG